jgi:hypothetical protein
MSIGELTISAAVGVVKSETRHPRETGNSIAGYVAQAAKHY